MSGNSWANMGQECIKCHINVYPHKQVRRRENAILQMTLVKLLGVASELRYRIRKGELEG